MNEFNFIVINGNQQAGDIQLFFGPMGEDDKVIGLSDGQDMFDILVMSGLFPSKSQAMKNWKLTGKDIPNGFSDFQRLGKMKKRLTILNPIGE